MRYRLRTLLILMAIAPPILAIGYANWQRHRERQQFRKLALEMFAESERQRQGFLTMLSQSSKAVPQPRQPNSSQSTQ